MFLGQLGEETSTSQVKEVGFSYFDSIFNGFYESN